MLAGLFVLELKSFSTLWSYQVLFPCDCMTDSPGFIMAVGCRTPQLLEATMWLSHRLFHDYLLLFLF